MHGLKNFLGIDFGESRESVKEKMLSRENCYFDEENSSNQFQFFKGVKFAGRETDFIMLLFYENKFCKSAIFIKPKLQSQIVQLYQDIKSEINNKYYKTDDDFEHYEYPYEKNDGHIETAISLGKANFSSYWVFPDQDGIDDFITLKITEDFDVVINYEDGNLTGKMVDENNEENSLDY